MPAERMMGRGSAGSAVGEGVQAITTAILAGGLGTRLRSVVGDRPKVLASVGGRPFLAYLLEQLLSHGITHAVLCTGYLGEQVPSVFGEAYRGIRLSYSREATPLGTGGALRLALPFFESESVLVMNWDSYCAADLRAFWAWHSARRAQASLLLRHMPETARYGRVRVDEAGRVLGFDEKSVVSGPGWINAGIYLLSRRLLRTIRPGQVVSLEREMFPAWAGQGLLCGYQSEGDVLDIGTPESFAASQEAMRGVKGSTRGRQRGAWS